MGRPTKLNDDTIDILVKCIKKGLTYADAAQLAGIHRRTFERWRKKAETAKTGIYCRLHRSLKKAEVEARLVLLKRIHDAADGKQVVHERRIERDADGNVKKTVKIVRQIPPVWQAAAWILERRWPEEFGRKAKPVQDDRYDPLGEWLDGLVEAESQYGQSR